MTLKFYNTLTRKKDIFKPIENGKVGMYNCGPTVYWFQTIGNLRTYIFSDVLRKVLEFNGLKVKQVMNVTDVGHLTSDADEGEDKMEKAAIKEGKKAEDIANYYLSVFKEDFKKLNIKEPNVWCKATEHIKEQIELVRKLEEKGFTYKTNDGIYFDSSKLSDYGKLAKLNIKGLKEGKRINLREKRNKTDFVLWKFSSPDEKRQQEWDSPWGVGFPGWHVECSAMSMKYLGEQFDIHTGGVDHIPVHHTNEIAQSEATTGKRPWVKYWLHGEFLTFKGEKVSKSKGGLYTISELEKLGYKPLAYRYLCLSAHYRKQLEFSLDSLNTAQNSYNRLKNIIKTLTGKGKLNKNYIEKFRKEINNDLNMSRALAVLWGLIRDEKIFSGDKRRTIEEMEKVLGLDLLKKEKVEIPKEIKQLAEERQKAREGKNWNKSDEIRNLLKEKGWGIKDTKDSWELEKE